MFKAATSPTYNKYLPPLPLSDFPTTLLEITVLEIVNLPLLSTTACIGPLTPVIIELVKVTFASLLFE